MACAFQLSTVWTPFAKRKTRCKNPNPPPRLGASSPAAAFRQQRSVPKRSRDGRRSRRMIIAKERLLI